MAITLEVTGKFLGASKTQVLGANNFTVRKFYVDLTDNSMFPNTPEFQLTGDKVSLVDNLIKGQEITVKFNLSGRRFKNQETGKEGVITNLSAWRIDVLHRQSTGNAAAGRAGAAPQPQQTAPAPAQAPQAQRLGMAQQPFAPIEGEDDLPF